jgi:hypothetical protein
LFFVFGIARSWQLVGARNISLASTLAAVMHRLDTGEEASAPVNGGQEPQPAPPPSQGSG